MCRLPMSEYESVIIIFNMIADMTAMTVCDTADMTVMTVLHDCHDLT